MVGHGLISKQKKCRVSYTFLFSLMYGLSYNVFLFKNSAQYLNNQKRAVIAAPAQ